VQVRDAHGRVTYVNRPDGDALTPDPPGDPAESAEARPGPRESRRLSIQGREARNHLTLRLPVTEEAATPDDAPEAATVVLTADVTEATRPATHIERAGNDRAPDTLVEANAELSAANADLSADNAALRRSNRDLSEFAYIASHDLAAPLRVISGYVQLLSQRYADQLDAKGQRWIGWTVDGVERMEELIAGLLTYSRLDSAAAEHEPVDLPELVEAAAASTAGDQGVDGHVHAGGLPTVHGERRQLRQLFENLLANAWKFRAPDRAPEVEVTARSLGDRWEITVADNGIGIPPEQRERVLRMFQRLHTRDEVPGTGIGLAVVQRVVERHGGGLTIETSHLGGTALRFDLPAVGSDEHAAPTAPGGAA